MTRHRLAALVLVSLVAACNRAPPPPAVHDAGTDRVVDAGQGHDGGTVVDGGGAVVDGGAGSSPSDAGEGDAGPDVTIDGTPPAGGDCGRAWDTFFPDEVYLVGRLPHGSLGGCAALVVAGFDDLNAYAPTFDCGGAFQKGIAAIRRTDGRLIYEDQSAIGVYEFRADVVDSDGGPCVYATNALVNDIEVPTPACDDDGTRTIQDFRLKHGGGYIYACSSFDWYDEHQQHLTIDASDIVLAVNDDNDVLVVSSEDVGASFTVILGDGTRVPVSGMAADVVPHYGDFSAKADDSGFLFVAANQSYAATLVHIDFDGSVRTEGTFATTTDVDLTDARLGSDRALYGVANDFPSVAIKFLPDGSPGMELLVDGDGPVGVGFFVTGP